MVAATGLSEASESSRRRGGIARKVESLLNRLWVSLAVRPRGISVGKYTSVSPLASLSSERRGDITIGARCKVMRGAILWTYGGSITIGDSTAINPYCVLYGHGGLRIGSGVRIAAHVVIIPANHGIEPGEAIRHQPETRRGIVIGDDVWIGAGARILDGVNVASGSVIGAGAVLTRSTEPFGIYAGVPARKIGDRRTRGA
jgi:acetyltransferase-like isoleucine patch superfamily enzyme